MKDELKEYVATHRASLEIYQPRDQIWKGISDELQGQQLKTKWRWMAVAASLLLVVSTAALTFVARERSKASEALVQSSTPIRQAELYFNAISQMKNVQLGQYCGTQPALCHEFEHDLERLAQAYQHLKNEYANSADKEAILQAMMNNLQMQVQLINQQLKVMETVKQTDPGFEIL